MRIYIMRHAKNCFILSMSNLSELLNIERHAVARLPGGTPKMTCACTCGSASAARAPMHVQLQGSPYWGSSTLWSILSVGTIQFVAVSVLNVFNPGFVTSWSTTLGRRKMHLTFWTCVEVPRKYVITSTYIGHIFATCPLPVTRFVWRSEEYGSGRRTVLWHNTF